MKLQLTYDEGIEILIKRLNDYQNGETEKEAVLDLLSKLIDDIKND